MSDTVSKTTKPSPVRKCCAHCNPFLDMQCHVERCEYYMPRHKTTAALRHVDEYERAGMFPAAFDGMSALRSSGLITAEHRGWGHYRVTITDSGRKTLEAASGQ